MILLFSFFSFSLFVPPKNIMSHTRLKLSLRCKKHKTEVKIYINVTHVTMSSGTLLFASMFTVTFLIVSPSTTFPSADSVSVAVSSAEEKHFFLSTTQP